MTTPRPFRPRAGGAVTTLFLGALAISAASGLVIAPLVTPAAAQSVATPNDQPTPATIPGRTSGPADRSTGQVAPPTAISSSTTIVAADPKTRARTNPLDHLPAGDRAGTGGSRRD